MVLFNNSLISSESIGPLLSNRGFLYGDGFFETISIRSNKLFFLEGHQERAQHAMQVLQLEGASEWTTEHLFASVQQLWIENGKPADAVVKWIGWRNSEGLYAPQEQQAMNSLFELKPFRSAPALKANALLATSVQNRVSSYSFFKKLSSIHYVMTGLEKTKRETDELILLDQYGNLSEATSSSLFWIIKDILYTPSLDTGCIAGVSRQYILKMCLDMKLPAEETEQSFDSLTEDATVFTANISGISLVGAIENRSFKNDHPCIQRLQQALFSPFYGRSLETTN